MLVDTDHCIICNADVHSIGYGATVDGTYVKLCKRHENISFKTIRDVLDSIKNKVEQPLVQVGKTSSSHCSKCNKPFTSVSPNVCKCNSLKQQVPTQLSLFKCAPTTLKLQLQNEDAPLQEAFMEAVEYVYSNTQGHNRVEYKQGELYIVVAKLKERK